MYNGYEVCRWSFDTTLTCLRRLGWWLVQVRVWFQTPELTSGTYSHYDYPFRFQVSAEIYSTQPPFTTLHYHPWRFCWSYSAAFVQYVVVALMLCIFSYLHWEMLKRNVQSPNIGFILSFSMEIRKGLEPPVGLAEYENDRLVSLLCDHCPLILGTPCQVQWSCCNPPPPYPAPRHLSSGRLTPGLGVE